MAARIHFAVERVRVHLDTLVNLALLEAKILSILLETLLRVILVYPRGHFLAR